MLYSTWLLDAVAKPFRALGRCVEFGTSRRAVLGQGGKTCRDFLFAKHGSRLYTPDGILGQVHDYVHSARQHHVGVS